MKAKPMQGKDVIVQLYHPILLMGKSGSAEHATPIAVVRLEANLKELHDGGVILEVRGALDQREQRVTPNPAILFLPFHKIDHILLA